MHFFDRKDVACNSNCEFPMEQFAQSRPCGYAESEFHATLDNMLFCPYRRRA